MTDWLPQLNTGLLLGIVFGAGGAWQRLRRLDRDVQQLAKDVAKLTRQPTA